MGKGCCLFAARAAASASRAAAEQCCAHAAAVLRAQAPRTSASRLARPPPRVSPRFHSQPLWRTMSDSMLLSICSRRAPPCISHRYAAPSLNASKNGFATQIGASSSSSLCQRPALLDSVMQCACLRDCGLAVSTYDLARQRSSCGVRAHCARVSGAVRGDNLLGLLCGDAPTHWTSPLAALPAALLALRSSCSFDREVSGITHRTVRPGGYTCRRAAGGEAAGGGRPT